MTSAEEAVELEQEIEDKNHNLIRDLKHIPSGIAFIQLLENLSNVALSRLVNADPSDVGRVATAQARYYLISRLLERIFEEEEEDNA